MKAWKTWTGPLLGGRAWSRGLKSALSKILQNKEHYPQRAQWNLNKIEITFNETFAG